MTATSVRYSCPRCRSEYADPAPSCCTRCASPLWRRPDGWAGYDLPRQPRKIKIMSAAQLAAKHWPTRTAGPCWSGLLGKQDMPARVTVGLTGEPSAGKSTLALALAEDGTFQRPLLIAGEEGLSQSISERLARAEARRVSVCDAQVLPEALDAAADLDADLVIIDSVTALHWSMDEVGSLAVARPQTSVIAVHQWTKSGVFSGTMDWVHMSDLWVEVAAFRWKVTKSWHGQVGAEGDV